MLKLKNKWPVWFVFCWSLAISLYCQYPLLKNKYLLSDDVRQTVFWMFNLRDNQLFKGDIHLEYSSWIAPPLVKFIYGIGTFFIDPLLATKILPILFTIVLSIYGYKLGSYLKDKLTGLFFGCLLSVMAWYREFIWFEDANASCFLPLLLIAFLYYFVKKDFLKAGIILVLEAISYPPSFLISLGVWFGSLINLENRKAKVKYLLLPLLLSGFLLFNKYYFNSGFGSLINREQMKEMSEFYPTRIANGQEIKKEGRTPMFYPSLYQKIANERIGINLNRFTIFLFVLALISIRKLKRIPALSPEIWYFIISGIVCFILAHIFLLKLFEPSRYLRVSLPIFLSLINIIAWRDLLSQIESKKYLLFMISILLVLGFYLPNIQGDRDDWSKDRELYQFLSSLPKEVLIAGPPLEMNNIPTFAKRKVLILEELSLPYYPKFYREIKRRTYDFYKIYYGSSYEEIREIINKYKIDYLVVYKQHFSDDYLKRDIYYLSPFNDFIKEQVIKNKGQYFFMTSAAKVYKVYENESLFVLEVKRLKNGFN